MTVTPAINRVLLKMEKTEESTSSGIILVDNTSNDTVRGRVVAVGSGRNGNGNVVAIPVRLGDLAVIPKNEGDSIIIDGEDHRVVQYVTIICTIEENNDSTV